MLMSFYQLKVRVMNSIMMMLYGKMLHFVIIMWLYNSKEVQYDELRGVLCKFYGKNLAKS